MALLFPNAPVADQIYISPIGVKYQYTGGRWKRYAHFQTTNSFLAMLNAQKAIASGVATLDESVKVPAEQLPALDFVPTSAVGAASGVATLDEVGKVPSSQLPSLNYVPTSAVGAASGVATLDGSGKVPSSQLPSYVDDVLEFANLAALPGTGESGKLYITLDDGVIYRWTGSIYAVSGGGGALALSNIDSSSTYYLALSSASTGDMADVKVASNDLYFSASDKTLYSTNYNSLSDARLKDNIETIVSGLNTVNQMRGVGYNWKANGNKTYGVIAQEIEALVPEIVSENNNIKSVNYNAIIGFLIEAVKELSAKVEKLEQGNDI